MESINRAWTAKCLPAPALPPLWQSGNGAKHNTDWLKCFIKHLLMTVMIHPIYADWGMLMQ